MTPKMIEEAVLGALSAARISAPAPVLEPITLEQITQAVASGISNDKIDSMYQAAINAGALAGKLLGAGAGGFLMLFAHKEDHAAIELALGDYKRCYFSMEEDGAKVIYNDERSTKL